jgi:twitching motility two-component system response regulator PilG
MRAHLEFDNNDLVAVVDGPADEEPLAETAVETLKRGIAAAQKGDRECARELLTRASVVDPQCEEAWMWLASISEYPEELLAFLNNVLEINPQNKRAVDWHAATCSLLAKTFVQRGVTAHEDGSAELAISLFDQALEHDEKCTLAWLWKARLASTDDDKVECLERVLEIDPDNIEANEAIAPFREPTPAERFEEAKWAAVAGRRNEAMQLLDEVLDKAPDNAEAWILRSHFSLDLDDKIAALEKALEIDPENHAARASFDFLRSTVSAASAPADDTATVEAVAERGQEPEVEEPAAADAEDSAASPADVPELQEDMDEPAAIEQDLDTSADDTVSETAEQPQPAAAAGPFDELASEVVDEEEEVLAGPSEPADNGPTLEEILGAVHDGTGPDTPTLETVQADDVDDAVLLEPVIEEAAEDQASPLFDAAPEFVAECEVFAEPEVAQYADTPTIVEADAQCAFCEAPVSSQAFECRNCRALLTLSDIESLLAHKDADHELIQQAVDRLEAERQDRELTSLEMTVLGIGLFNLESFDKGFNVLQEASRLEPNNVILAGQVNAIAIRLDEIRRQNEIDETKPKGKTILVVDDSPTVRKLISAKLEKSGHNVTCAADGVEGLEKLSAGLPDLVLLDITMPRMDGYEVCKQIRANPAAAAMPVVMISGKDGFFDKVRGKMAGCTGYVTKPFGPETLMKALETYLVPENGHAG